MEIRRSYDRLISTMGFPIPVRCHLNIESGPCTSPTQVNYRMDVCCGSICGTKYHVMSRDYGDLRSHTLAVMHIWKYYLPCYVTRLWLLKKPPHLSCHAHRQVLSHDFSYLRSHTLVVMHTGKYYFVFLTHVKKNCPYPVISSVIILWW